MAIDKSSRVWDGVYRSFSEVPSDTPVFEDSLWLNKATERARQSLLQSVGNSAVPPVAQTSDYALPFVAALVAQREKPLRILDFGGGMGTSFFPVVKMLPANQIIDFVIVENRALCTAGREFFKDHPQISFREAIPEPGDSYDIIHCGSSLHYVDDWKGMLDRFAAIKPEYILFADLPAADNRSFVTSQIFHGHSIPVHFWNLDEFISCVQVLGYELILRSRYRGYYIDRDADLPTAHFEFDYRLAYMAQLIFRATTPHHSVGVISAAPYDKR